MAENTRLCTAAVCVVCCILAVSYSCRGNVGAFSLAPVIPSREQKEVASRAGRCHMGTCTTWYVCISPYILR